MDIVIGIAFWGGLLWLTLAWLLRSGRSQPAGGQEPRDEAGRQVDEALVDGLVIGHFLTRGNHERRVDALEDEVQRADDERARWIDAGTAAGDDYLEHDLDYPDLDYAEYDAMGGFGVEPWADDLFDFDDED